MAFDNLLETVQQALTDVRSNLTFVDMRQDGVCAIYDGDSSQRPAGYLQQCGGSVEHSVSVLFSAHDSLQSFDVNSRVGIKKESVDIVCDDKTTGFRIPTSGEERYLPLYSVLKEVLTR